jgi:glycosyltransferase involved in cell wall biosynthesis
LIDAGRTGELVRVADPDALAQQIAAYAIDPLRARTVGAVGRVTVEQRFSIAAMSQRYQDLYDRLLQSRTGRADRDA